MGVNGEQFDFPDGLMPDCAVKGWIEEKRVSLASRNIDTSWAFVSTKEAPGAEDELAAAEAFAAMKALAAMEECDFPEALLPDELVGVCIWYTRERLKTPHFLEALLEGLPLLGVIQKQMAWKRCRSIKDGLALKVMENME